MTGAFDVLLVEPSATPGAQDYEHPAAAIVLDQMAEDVTVRCARDGLSVTHPQARAAVIATRARGQERSTWRNRAEQLLWGEEP